ncbi:ATPase [Calderihabitans maritimus]|uniref:ATPase n=1 Tax=Calderihabitans maritimus TaxID=1246530 RepID=A0A1Z5HQS5_9FIRM|nr:ATPase [Calderihabitans maritimus]
MLVRTLGQVLSLKFSRIQFTPDLMPADIVGTQVLTEEQGRRQFVFREGPVFANLVLADEINRATPKTQSALLEAMQEGSVTVGGQTRKLPRPFFVLATQNPLEMEGTYPLPEAQVDRFLFKLLVEFPSREELVEIMNRTTGIEKPVASTVATGEEILAMEKLAREVPAAPHVTDYAVRLIMATHPERPEAPEGVKKYVRYGASPRGLQALMLSARVHALMEGRYNVAFDDLRYVAYPALRHRVFLNFEGQAEGYTPDRIISLLLEEVPLEI